MSHAAEMTPAPLDTSTWKLRLYVAGRTPRSAMAEENLRRICQQYLPGIFHIEIVDLLVDPHLAKADQIFAIPTLVRELPTPLKKIIGDLSDANRVLLGLELRPPAHANGS